MASLNTLRTKYGLVLSILIGLVLVAFILGDQLSMSGRQEATDKVEAVINGREITTEEYYEAQQFLGTSQTEIVDAYLDYKYYYAPQFEALGLETEDVATMQKAIAQAMLNNGATEDVIRKELSNLTPIGLIQVYQSMIQSEVFANGIFMNTADLEVLEAKKNLTFAGRYVEYPYANAEPVEVSESEVKAYYAAHPEKNLFYNIRTVSYVEFEANEEGEDVSGAVESFVSSLDGTVESFETAVAEAVLVPVEKRVDELQYTMPEVVMWAQSTTPGAYRDFVVGDKTIVAMVVSIDNNEYRTLEDRWSQIETKLANDKKFAAIAETMVLDGENVESFNGKYSDLSANLDPRVARAILVANEGVEYKVNGAEAAYIFVVEGIEGELGDVASQRVANTTTVEGDYVPLAGESLNASLSK